MKKFLSIIILISLVLPIFQHEFKASEEYAEVTTINDEEVREVLLSKAIEAFPEYEKEIRGENEINFGKARNGGMGEVVICETKRLSDTEVVTYTQYDSGIAMVASLFASGKEIVNAFHRGEYMYYQMDMWLVGGVTTDMLYVENFGCAIYPSTYDKILYSGDLDSTLCTVFSPIEEYIYYEENSNRDAEVSYGGYFRFNDGDGQIPYQLYGRLIVKVGNDTYTVSSS